MSNQEVTDLSYLREMAMGDDEIVIETTEVFLEDTPNALDNLQEHFANQEWDKLKKQAHKIKPNTQYMGMDRARELILEIEEQAKTENISEDLGSKIKEFNSICRQALDELSAKLDKIKSQ